MPLSPSYPLLQGRRRVLWREGNAGPDYDGRRHARKEPIVLAPNLDSAHHEELTTRQRRERRRGDVGRERRQGQDLPALARGGGRPLSCSLQADREVRAGTADPCAHRCSPPSGTLFGPPDARGNVPRSVSPCAQQWASGQHLHLLKINLQLNESTFSFLKLTSTTEKLSSTAFGSSAATTGLTSAVAESSSSVSVSTGCSHELELQYVGEAGCGKSCSAWRPCRTSSPSCGGTWTGMWTTGRWWCLGLGCDRGWWCHPGRGVAPWLGPTRGHDGLVATIHSNGERALASPLLDCSSSTTGRREGYRTKTKFFHPQFLT
jgi:hypothetical protein